ncbi:2-polyprenyl-6-methoxyphenol hydroxylase-like FAD-dependent oxidoreductase [Pseudonocardia hierapolitana]|uniref:2-polyprenyl-6-methoxyphenol hydroxylase-like FAD-dependent oxidoreductase n=1 Tax=Pseudonocardia hierapolitana TaxID=1128676 RepID=A0A561SIU2_9PSEU|nr:FAD-dependent monooxygenase [Pseudonocardia hierapolitana]TWF74796.1 2-polyprenyl-6-methoxyphenol hydroxylase-like FAD-dependent oxidoreductase [Pseudonocardia hierapolitana]
MSEVVVVGAGPTGLLLAGDLAAAGVRVTVLERRLHESNLTRAFVVHARTLEQLDARGVADRLLATGTKVDHFRLFGSVSVDLAPLPSRFPFMLVTPQFEVERVLTERALAAGATLLRGADVRDVRQTADHVEVTYTLDGAERTVRAAYLVGADGHHSAVRRELGLGFPGRSVVRSLVLADLRMTDPPTEQLTVDGNADGFCFVVPFGDGWYRVIARDRRKELPDDAPVELDEIAWVARRVFGTDFGMHDPRWMSRFHSDERQVERYRVGRVFLAGDAAHVHSPAGGMGMNTGLQDAADLGWKLAAAVQGRGGDRLLDTYHDERHPVGRMVLRMSGGLLQAALLRSRLARTIRNIVFPAAFALPPIGAMARLRQSGIGISYGRPRGAHRLVGTRAADVTADDGTRLYEALRGGRFVLVAPPGFATPGGVAAHVVSGAETALLVRPDGYVAWAGRNPDGLRAALADWGATPAVAA